MFYLFSRRRPNQIYGKCGRLVLEQFLETDPGGEWWVIRSMNDDMFFFSSCLSFTSCICMHLYWYMESSFHISFICAHYFMLICFLLYPYLYICLDLHMYILSGSISLTYKCATHQPAFSSWTILTDDHFFTTYQIYIMGRTLIKATQPCISGFAAIFHDLERGGNIFCNYSILYRRYLSGEQWSYRSPGCLVSNGDYATHVWW